MKLPLDGIVPSQTVPVSFETNGSGWHGFLVLPPGAFVRGATVEEALAKTDSEVRTFLRWAGARESKSPYSGEVAEIHTSNLSVEDADNELLLSADVGEIEEPELAVYFHLLRLSSISFQKLRENVSLPDWVDVQRVRMTFWGRNPSTPREIYDHVYRTQLYYLSRLGLEPKYGGNVGFVQSREASTEILAQGWKNGVGSRPIEVDGELWTIRKVLRRFLWHDRIHAKAIVRVLEKQRRAGLIRSYDDPFGFFMDEPRRATSRT